MVRVVRTSSARTASRVFCSLAIMSAILASLYLLIPNPLADVFFAGIVLLSVLFSLIGGIGVWLNRTSIVWVAAFLLTGLAIIGMLSIGLFIAPAALFLFLAALFSQLSGPRTEVQEAIHDDPPTVPQAVLRTLVGAVSMVVGVIMVHFGAFSQELFGACASETAACALNKTNWDGVGLTVLGLVILSLGGWLLWKQVYIARVLSSAQTQ